MRRFPQFLLIFYLTTALILWTSSSSQQLTPERVHKLLQISRQYQHKFEIDIDTGFSEESDVTIVLTSCNRLDLLKITLNSFFHFNTYVLHQFILIQDCAWNQQDVWMLLPKGAIQYRDRFFRVLVNHKRLGQIASIDRAYSYVRTKYVYHLEDDWAQFGSFGFLQRIKDALEHAEQNNLKISQAIQTLSEWSWTHMLGTLHRSSHHTKYYTINSYGKSYLYKFSFNPHLINFQNIYQKQLNGSYMNSIARRYHCINTQESSFMQNGGCVEQYMGKHLSNLSYLQIYVETRKKALYQHIGDRQKKFTIDSFNFEKEGPNPQAIKKQISSNLANQTANPIQSIQEIEPKSPNNQQQESTKEETTENSVKRETARPQSQKQNSIYQKPSEQGILKKIITILITCILLIGIYKSVKTVLSWWGRIHKRRYDVRIGYDVEQ